MDVLGIPQFRLSKRHLGQGPGHTYSSSHVAVRNSHKEDAVAILRQHAIMGHEVHGL